MIPMRPVCKERWWVNQFAHLSRSETKLADTRSGEILESGTTQTASADNCYGGLLQLELTCSRSHV